MKTTTKQSFITRIGTDAINRVPHLLLTFMLVLGLALMGCEGPTGDQGAKGDKGDRGAIGPAGEDGSQIHSGTDAPPGSLGKVGDFYLDKSSYELYGPKTGNGWGSPLNLKGANGNANVTRYIFPGHDFSTDHFAFRYVPNVSESEMLESGWLVYLRTEINGRSWLLQIPGHGTDVSSEYRVGQLWFPPTGGSKGRVQFRIYLVSGAEEIYEDIYVVRIEASSTEDLRKARTGEAAIIPDHLDVSNYEEVAEYYGFGGAQ